MENDVIDALTDVGYTGCLNEESLFEKCVDEGIKNVDFRELIVWICKELTTLLQLDESVSSITQEEDVISFVMEISSLLKELGCPYQGLIEGPVSERLSSKDHRLLLLDYLLTELMAARMIRTDRPQGGPELRLRETDTAKDLKAMLLTLQFPKPPNNITPVALFSKVETKLKDTVARAPAGLCGKPLLWGRLSAEQWKTLEDVNSELQQEYRLRRDMLLKRLDVTCQSFQWCDRAKSNEDAIAKKLVEKRRNLTVEPNVVLADILAAREDVAIIPKTSSKAARKNTKSSVHKVIIGRVPDRGGRPSEQEAPPPEMPSWQKDRAQGGGGGGGRGGGQFTRGGGGRVQGNWNQRDDRSDKGNYHDNRREDRGGYNDNKRDDRGHYDKRDDRHHYDNRRDDRGGYEKRRDYHDDRGEYRDRGGRGGGRGGRGRDYR